MKKSSDHRASRRWRISWVAIAVAGTLPIVAGAQSISVGSTPGTPGSTAQVSVGFAPGATPVSTMQFDLSLDSRLSFGGVSPGPAASAAGKTVVANAMAGSVRILVFAMNQTIIEAGVVAVVRLGVAAGTPAGSLAIGVGGITCSSSSGMAVPASGTGGSISIAVPGGGGGSTNAPILSEIRSADATETTANILWRTSKPTNSEVEYGPTGSYGFKTSDATLQTQHSIALLNLTPGTMYHYRVTSSDSERNLAISGGYIFKTAGQPPAAPTTTLSYPGVGLVRGASNQDIVHMGVAITNLGDKPISVKFSALGEDGSPVQGVNLANPASRALSAGQQIPLVDAQLFGTDFSKSPTPGAFRVEASGSQLAATFMLFNERLTVLDGAIVTAPPSSNFVFPEIDAGGYTKIAISNPEPEPANLALELRRSDGSIRSLASHTLPGNGSLNADLFADIFPQVAPDGTDYLLGQSTRNLAPFEILGKDSDYLKILRGQDSGAGAVRLYSPQYVVGGGWRTTLSLINLGETAGSVTLTLRGDYGLLMGSSRVIQIAGRGKVVVDDPSFFVPSGGGVVQGYVEITSNGPRLTGSVSFGNDQGSRSASALPLVADLRKAQVFGHVASTDTYFTGIAIINPSDSPVDVTVEVYDSVGTPQLSSTRTIAARSRSSRVLTELFPAMRGQCWTSGYIRVTADLPVAAFALFGAKDLSVLSAIPGQSAP